MIEFRVLGEVSLRVDGQRIPVRGALQQAILAALLIEANQPVPGDQLLERAWGTHRWPARPRAALRSQLSLLRRTLAPALGVTIRWQPAGYRLTVDTGFVDVHRFHLLVGYARAAEDEERAAMLLEQAVGLWRGEAFASLDTPWLAARRTALDQERHAARLDLLDAQLHRGQHAHVLTELTDLTTTHPWDERLAGQFNLALSRSGRRADAIAHYHQVRTSLAEELGSDPSSVLEAAYQQILT